MSKIIVITGASSGIGMELKKLFEDRGDIVVSISRSEVVSDRSFSADVVDEKKIKEVFASIGEKFGHIDMLINNAGVGMSGVTELLPSEDIRKVIDINYFGLLNCVKYALPLMGRGGRIVNMSSAMALFPVPFRAIYGSVKSAVLSLSFSLRMELRPLGIDVVAICPGDIKTNFTANRLKNFETNERYGDRIKVATLKNDSREEKRISADICAKRIFKILQKKKCKPFYIIGEKYKMLYFFTRITPKSWLLGITGKLLGGVEKKKDNK